MRNIERTVDIKGEVLESKTATKEQIITIQENKEDEAIFLEVALFCDNGNKLKVETFNIINENYDLLMSESPNFAIGKPKNEYRESDLYYFVDLIRNQR